MLKYELQFFAKEGEGGEKTEEATPKKLEDARKEGLALIKKLLDENRLDYYDIVHSMNEDRYITIGLVEEVIVVVYTLRKTRIRIISARLATRKERELYYEENY